MFDEKYNIDNIKDIKNYQIKIKKYYMSLMHSADIIDFLSNIEEDQIFSWMRLIENKKIKSKVFFLLEKNIRVKLIKQLDLFEIFSLIENLESNDATDIMDEFSVKYRNKILKNISKKKQKQISNLIRYPKNTAGGIMKTEFIRVDYNDTVASALKKINKFSKKKTEILLVWVVNKENQLLGSVKVVDLILNRDKELIKSLTNKRIVSVNSMVNQEKICQIFQKYNLTVLPVIDDNNLLLGGIYINDIFDVLFNEANEDTMHMAGISVEFLKKSKNFLSILKLRFPWLAVSLLYSLMSSFLLKTFEVILQKTLFLLILLPVITAMAGNVGTQSATVLIREFAIGKSNTKYVFKLIFKEFFIGFIFGSTYGFVTSLVAIFSFADGNYYVGFCVLIVMIIAMSVAAIMGVVAPLILKALNFDPAIASGPFVTTFNDITGILVLILTANIFINKLS